MSPFWQIIIGVTLVYVIPAAFAALFWLCVREIAHLWQARDVMTQLRPSRHDVAATDRALDDIHYDIVTDTNDDTPD